jgi:hypothetical protein
MQTYKKTSMNRLDRMPSDCLLHILSFCEDHLQFDVKRKVLYEREFQDKLQKRLLKAEYDDADENEIKWKELFILQEMKYYNFPSGSLTFQYDAEEEKYFMNADFRKPVSTGKNNPIKYDIQIVGREFKFKQEEELREEMTDRMEGDIIFVSAGFIYQNLYKKQKDKLDIVDIEGLQQAEMYNVLNAICDINGVVDDIIHYEGFGDFLGLRTCIHFEDDLFLVEEEN